MTLVHLLDIGTLILIKLLKYNKSYIIIAFIFMYLPVANVFSANGRQPLHDPCLILVLCLL